MASKYLRSRKSTDSLSDGFDVQGQAALEARSIAIRPAVGRLRYAKVEPRREMPPDAAF